LNSSLITRYTDSRPGYYAANTDTRPEIELDSYWTVDLKLEQTIAQHWKVAVQALNLFDEQYDTYLLGFTDQTTYAYTHQPYPGAGRSVFASLSYTW
jgi:outer membrane receptor protein involved in Fe transport